jgi:hypothetical protein
MLPHTPIFPFSHTQKGQKEKEKKTLFGVHEKTTIGRRIGKWVVGRWVGGWIRI